MIEARIACIFHSGDRGIRGARVKVSQASFGDWWLRFGAWRGINKSESISDWEVLRESLRIRCRQSAPGLVAYTLSAMASMTAALQYNFADRVLIWFVPNFLSLLFQALFARKTLRTLSNANEVMLTRADRVMRRNVMVNQSLMGISIWYVVPDHNPEVAFFVTLMQCLFAIGSMINLASDFRSFSVSLPLLLLQPIAYWFSEGGLGIAIGSTLLVLTVLMLLAARRNAGVFRESVLVRFEKERLLNELMEEKEQVKAALEIANQANESKAFFMAAASHDLRQPLYAATLLSDSMLMLPSEKNQRTLLDKQKQALDILKTQLDNLLDLSRFEAGQIRTSVGVCALDHLFEQLGIEFAPLAESKGVALKMQHSGINVRTDGQLLHRLLSNLISNAIKNTAQGEVSINATKRENVCTVRVHDTGCGIPNERVQEIFNAYVQLDNLSRNREKGVGLGLAIARHIDELLGLSLEIESTSVQGSVFCFQLPYVADTPEYSLESAFHYTTYEPDIVLMVWIVEDDPIVTAALTEHLVLVGCETYSAVDWPGIIKLSNSLQRWPDAVITDDMLGQQETGLDIANKLRRHMALESILISTGSQLESRLAELNASAFVVMQKPISRPGLHAWLASVAERKKG